MLACTGTGEYAVHVLASPSVYHSFDSGKEILLTAGLLTNSSDNFSKVKSGRICCSEASTRCTDNKVRPLGSNVVDSKPVCTCFVPQVTVNGAFTVARSAGRSVNTLPEAVHMVCGASAFSFSSALGLEVSDWIDNVGQPADTSVVHDFTGTAGTGTAAAAPCWGSLSQSRICSGRCTTRLRLAQALCKQRPDCSKVAVCLYSGAVCTDAAGIGHRVNWRARGGSDSCCGATGEPDTWSLCRH